MGERWSAFFVVVFFIYTHVVHTCVLRFYCDLFAVDFAGSLPPSKENSSPHRRPDLVLISSLS